jgi:hypothetical protein
MTRLHGSSPADDDWPLNAVALLGVCFPSIDDRHGRLPATYAQRVVAAVREATERGRGVAYFLRPVGRSAMTASTKREGRGS